ncbi:GGDEF domain-containing protein [Vibrio quintilis]|uniref:diguanylate cyclase n=1 Tax=Vibrio quintilis TaxID=1117707 RepID=A0A1M7YU32_9VIBR|nr:GGDEF domain-containing protein [Vibrio quintilis]SHO56164.1 Response regulator PleD [Vibrio quintilis]
MDDRLHKQSHTFRISVLSGISLFLTILALFLAIFHLIYQKEYWLALGECILSIYSGFIYTKIKQNQYSRTSVLYYAYYLIFIFGIGNYLEPISQGLFVWSCFAPITLYLLLGIKHGMYATGVFLIAQFILVAIKFSNNQTYDILSLMFNLTLCYCGIWVISHLYESNRYHTENSLLYLASRDSLTGTHNRLSLANFFSQFTQKKNNKDPLCLLILDIDFFKQINDQFGHDVGDKVLIEISLLISRIVGDNNLFRIGGEEFCVTLHGKDINEARHTGEKLCNTVSNHIFNVGNKNLQLTLSIGICQYRTGDNLSDILKLADIELYKAKKNGRNQVKICQMPYEIRQEEQSDSV